MASGNDIRGKFHAICPLFYHIVGFVRRNICNIINPLVIYHENAMARFVNELD